jgi:hypothetical protein
MNDPKEQTPPEQPLPTTPSVENPQLPISEPDDFSELNITE